MKELTPLENMCFRAGAVLMLLGLALFLAYPAAGMCVYGIGVLLFALMRVRTEYTGRAASSCWRAAALC